MRRLLPLGILTALVVTFAPGASASVTIGSTNEPTTVQVLEGGGFVMVRFLPPERTTRKSWTAKAPDLRNGIYSSPYYNRSPAYGSSYTNRPWGGGYGFGQPFSWGSGLGLGSRWF